MAGKQAGNSVHAEGQGRGVAQKGAHSSLSRCSKNNMEHRTFVWQVRVAGQVRVHNPFVLAVVLIPGAPNAVEAVPILKAAPATGCQGTQGSRQGAVVVVQTVVIRLQ